jgi:hypothetical protein
MLLLGLLLRLEL